MVKDILCSLLNPFENQNNPTKERKKKTKNKTNKQTNNKQTK